ncbi:uncharacterized protein F4812DRAFT_462118 [Daldinia caldariorum]|uniref:uncharacterized protein n=1 Tax=Daldinia caldariorum TaxID=326644 RepID=UPI0020083BF1|nr:uncharacterized protein F4812DRAFT_462118 [Daldinia caldariorum]KAI1465275.1 hypothetical protein F4812DRAFT_462118 [Daldinia caldariorum]
MESPRDKARANWGEAQKIRTDIMAKISSLKKERGTTNTTSAFDEVEQTMAEFRLACMNVINHDFEYAATKNVEHFLWHAHTFLNGEYRKVMSRLLAQNQVVVRRKLEKQYRAFLRTSQSFYRVYIQRLSERFYIPQLHQVAHGTDIEPERIPSPDSTPPSRLRAMILKSCQITLVHLGDLVRYRCQMTEKLSSSSTNFDKALEYYGLANAVDPDDGSAHHQLAVLYQLQARHIDIVYHFHRSICIAKPHQLGFANLEREFKGLENSSVARKGPKDPNETMVTWFLRLHAYFFQGEPFSQQSELEEEVLHRIEMAVKSDPDDAILRRMTFINIAAYDVALEKVTASWTMQGSQSAQFLLRFNIRTFVVLLRVLKAGLLNESATSPSSQGQGENGDSAESPICFSQLLTRLLPFIRIYISWIYVSQTDTNKYREFLEPYVSDVYGLLADTLTLLNAITDQVAATATSRYLLPEDAEALGLRPFANENLPLFIQPGDLLSPSSPKKPKSRKPRQRASGCQYRPDTEAVWRIRDIVYCGVLLAESLGCPLILALRQHEGRDIECWDFTDKTPEKVPAGEAILSRMLKKLRIGNSKTKPKDLVRNDIESSSPDVAVANAKQPCEDNGDLDLEPQPQPDKGKLAEAKFSLLDTDLSGDSEMVNMVNKLLDPVEDSRPQSSRTQADTTYGMNTTTANEVFGQLGANSEHSSAQPSPASKPITSLPWRYFYKPTPHRSASQSNNQLPPDGDYIPRSAHGQLDSLEPSSYLNGLATSVQQAQVYDKPGNPMAPSPAFNRHESRNSRDSLEASRHAVLDSLTSALYAQHGLDPNDMPSSDNFANRVAASPYLGPRGSTPGTSGSPYPPASSSPYLSNLGLNIGTTSMERSASQFAAMSNPQSSPGLSWSNKPFGTYGGFQDACSPAPNASSPAGIDSAAVLPVGAKGTIPRFKAPGPPTPAQQPQSPWFQELTKSGSTLAFSHPSSLYGGTPAVPPAGLPNMTLSNGSYNASTPFGHLGTGYNSTEDEPYDFKRQLSGSAPLKSQKQRPK